MTAAAIPRFVGTPQESAVKRPLFMSGGRNAGICRGAMMILAMTVVIQAAFAATGVLVADDGPVTGPASGPVTGPVSRQGLTEQTQPDPQTISADAQTIREAVSRAIPLLERGSAGSASERQCFTCHNQAVPVLALVAARDAGFCVDAQNLVRQISHTAAHLERGRDDYKQGKGQGGQVLMAGYALWTLDAAGYPPDELTTSVAGYVIGYQRDKGHWEHRGSRPPSSGSDFSATYVALRALQRFAPADQSEQAAARRKAVQDWLRQERPLETEDHVFRLRALSALALDPASAVDMQALRQGAVSDLLALQREDGGWAQKGDMLSDAYATGTVLAALRQDGGIMSGDAVVERAIPYLLRTQCADGSWHVTTRAVPFQTYYESGFPHGPDQFLSIAATGWCVIALVEALPDRPGERDGEGAVKTR